MSPPDVSPQASSLSSADIDAVLAPGKRRRKARSEHVVTRRAGPGRRAAGQVQHGPELTEVISGPITARGSSLLSARIRKISISPSSTA